MRYVALLCVVCPLSACVSVHTEERERHDSAWSPTVIYHYEGAQQYSDARLEAVDYCADRFYAYARPSTDSSTTGEATFTCVGK
jgi:hypothetical protein